MTEVLNKQTGDVAPLPTAITIKEAIEARLAVIHAEPEGRNRQICDALMIGSPALRSQVQV